MLHISSISRIITAIKGLYWKISKKKKILEYMCVTLKTYCTCIVYYLHAQNYKTILGFFQYSSVRVFFLDFDELALDLSGFLICDVIFGSTAGVVKLTFREIAMYFQNSLSNEGFLSFFIGRRFPQLIRQIPWNLFEDLEDVVCLTIRRTLIKTFARVGRDFIRINATWLARSFHIENLQIIFNSL